MTYVSAVSASYLPPSPDQDDDFALEGSTGQPVEIVEENNHALPSEPHYMPGEDVIPLPRDLDGDGMPGGDVVIPFPFTTLDQLECVNDMTAIIEDLGFAPTPVDLAICLVPFEPAKPR
jgi:hypothetical protein